MYKLFLYFIEHDKIITEIKKSLMRILFFKSSSPHMIDNALRYTDNLTIPRTESPAQIYFFHVSKETSIQSSDIHIISAPDKQRLKINKTRVFNFS